MDEGSLSSLFVIVILLTLDALITLAYGALTNARQTQMREQAEAGSKRAKLVQTIIDRDIPRLQVTYQLSMLLLRFGIAILITVYIAQPIVIARPDVSSFLIYVVTSIVAAAIIQVLGDLVPEAIGSLYAVPIALVMITPITWLMTLLQPLVAVVLFSGKTISRAFGSSQLVSAVTEEEIMSMVDAGHTGGTIEEEEKEMIYSVLQLDQTLARELMTPRMDIIAFAIDTPVRQALATFIESGLSRIPVYEENIDNVAGLLYAKDLLSLWYSGNGETSSSIRDLVRPAYFVPETKRADVLLKELQNRNVHMAIVVDEYGGTAGLVTIENLIEEIIGDIRDEFDLNEEAEYVEVNENEYVVDASIDLDDFNELLKVDLDTEESDTLGGFIYMQIGRVPVVGETIETPELTLLVESIEGRRIRKVHVTRKLPEVRPADGEADKSEVPQDATTPSDT